MDENQGFFVNTPPVGAEVPTQSSPEIEMGYRIRLAKKDGFTDKEIVSELAKELPNVRQALKDGYKPEQIIEEYMLVSMGMGEVATRAASNLPSSFGKLVAGLAEVLTSPLQTAKTVLDLGAGILQSVLPENVVQAIGEDKASRDIARQVGQFYVDRYGSVDGAKRAIAEDPAGVLADVSTILSGGAGASKITADIAKVASKGSITAPQIIAPALSAAARTIDPLAAAMRASTAAIGGIGKNVITPIVGMQTGAGREAISQAFEAGRKGGTTAEQFREAISGRADPTVVLDIAKSNLEELNRLKQTEYRSGMVNIKNDKTILGFDDIDRALQNALNKVTYKGEVKNIKAAEKIAEAENDILRWKSLDPKEFHTPEGLDALKQKIGDILESVPFEQKTARASIGEIYNSIKSSIQKQAPTYAKTMKAYSDASEQVREVERALSIGPKASQDTAIRKLQSLMRDNVQTNYGQRVKLAKELEKIGGQEFMPGIAGQALSSLTPRGLQQITGGGLGALFALTGNIPQALTVGAVSSPRIMGEASYLTGLGARGAQRVGQAAPMIVNPQLYNLLYQSGNIQGLLE